MPCNSPRILRNHPLPDLSEKLIVKIDEKAPPGNVIPSLARLLRAIRDREYQLRAQQQPQQQPTT